MNLSFLDAGYKYTAEKIVGDDGDNVYEVDLIFDRRRCVKFVDGRGCRKCAKDGEGEPLWTYAIRWVGYTDTTWEHLSALVS